MSEGARLPGFVAPWVAEQRWYQGKGSAPSLRAIGEWDLGDPSDEALLRTHLLLDDSGVLAGTATEATLYQVPLSYRRAPLPDAPERALVGVVEAPQLLWVYDAPHDPAYAKALLELIINDGSVQPPTGPDGNASLVSVRGHRHPAARIATPLSSAVLRGEQSNTSIVLQLAASDGTPATPVICKLFRTLHFGENPDIVVQSELAESGCTLVPPPVGHLSGTWPSDEPSPDPGVTQTVSGHLAFAQEFLPGVEDAWRVALRAIENNEDFSLQARSLGVATAEVHAQLATVFPCVEASADEISGLADRMRERLAQSVAEVPELGRYAPAVDALVTRAENGEWPRLQRIHGDYHLGQVVAVPGKGWVLLDFEGEPIRPLHERCEPDQPLRDVAGMLRSFDYAAGSYEQAHPEQSDASRAVAAAWAATARAAFLDGYASRATIDLDSYRELLTLFEIDKALYEAIYESRNRPSWLPIPVTAISRLLA